jgi:hypothetical protein
VEDKQDYIAKLQVAVPQLHNCGATWRETVPVQEVFQGHPKAKRAYAWSHLDGKSDERTRFVAVLEIPPVDSAQRGRPGSNRERF